MIDTESFTPGSALAGGMMIGLAAALLLAGSGRIAGVSGILSGLLRKTGFRESWRWCFLLGLIASPWLYQAVSRHYPVVIVTGDTPLLIVSGIMVGLGTRYGSGCTSGHGICGLSQLSLRSLVATACFMAAGFFMVYLTRHLLTGA